MFIYLDVEVVNMTCASISAAIQHGSGAVRTWDVTTDCQEEVQPEVSADAKSCGDSCKGR